MFVNWCYQNDVFIFPFCLLLMTVATITVMTGSWCWIAITIMAFLLFQCTICQTCIIILESASISGENCIANQYFSWFWKLSLKTGNMVSTGTSWWAEKTKVAIDAKPCLFPVYLTISNSVQIRIVVYDKFYQNEHNLIEILSSEDFYIMIIIDKLLKRLQSWQLKIIGIVIQRIWKICAIWMRVMW